MGSPTLATIRLTTWFHPISDFVLLLTPARAQLDDGEPIKVGWGTQDLEVPAGTHRVEVYYPFIRRKAARNEVELTVEAGQTVNVRYLAPYMGYLFLWEKGAMKVS